MKLLLRTISLLTILISHPLWAGQDPCKSIPWDNMDLAGLENLAHCFVNLKTLPEATAQFGNYQIKGHAHSLARIESPLPNVQMLGFEIGSTSKIDAIKIDGMRTHFVKPFALSMASVKATLGKVKELPRIHYDSQQMYQVKLKKFKQSLMFISTNHLSEGELLQVEGIILRRPE